MHDNWERASRRATGDYVTVLIDKTVLHPSALELADRAATADPRLDVITWWNEGYTPLDEAGNLGRGWCIPTTGPRPAELYDPRAELDYAFASETRRGTDPIHYFRGKIVFGAYSRRLLETVRARTGRVFHPISPDYTSRIAALAFGTRLLDLGRPLLVSYNSARSNGRQAASSPAYARRFIEETAPAALEALPIPGLYASSAQRRRLRPRRVRSPVSSGVDARARSRESRAPCTRGPRSSGMARPHRGGRPVRDSGSRRGPPRHRAGASATGAGTAAPVGPRCRLRLAHAGPAGRAAVDPAPAAARAASLGSAGGQLRLARRCGPRIRPLLHCPRGRLASRDLT